MEREQVKNILFFYKGIDNEIALNKRMIAGMEEEYYSMSGGAVTESFIKSRNKISRPTEVAALNVPASVSEDLHGLYAENERLFKLKSAVLKELNKLPLPQRTIIYEFYIVGLHWVRISERINYSERQCKNIRNRALDKLGRRFSQNNSISGYEYPL